MTHARASWPPISAVASTTKRAPPTDSTSNASSKTVSPHFLFHLLGFSYRSSSLSLSLFLPQRTTIKKKKTQKKKFDCLWRQRLLRPSAENFFFSLKSVTVLCSIDLFGVDLTIFCVSVAIVVVSDVILLTGHYRIEFISMLHCYWIKLIWLNWGCWSRSTWNAVGCWTWNRNPADSTDRNGQNQILPTLKQIQQKFFINFLNF